MKRLRIPLRWLVPLVVLLLPLVFWLLILSVVPTDWARRHIAARMSAASGRSVQIQRVRVGLLGGIYLSGLEIGAPGGAADPWLKVANAHLNVSPLQCICGQVEPTRTVVSGITLRILRREDGSLELDDLIQGTTAAAQSESEHRACPLSRLSLQIRGAQVTIIDAPTRTRLELRDLQGRATSEGRSVTIQELHGSLNGGPIELVAQLDRSNKVPSFEGHLRAQGIVLSDGMSALGYLVPLLAGKAASHDGRLDLNLYLRGQGTSRAELRKSIVGNGAIQLDPIQLDGSRVLDELGAVVDLPAHGRIGSISSNFTIKQGKIASDDLTLELTKLPIVLAGWTDFDGTVDYRLRSESLLDRLPSKARDLLSDLSIDAKDLSALKIEGAIDAPTVSLNGVPLNPVKGGGTAAPAPGDDRQRLRELGRRLRDRILR